MTVDSVWSVVVQTPEDDLYDRPTVWLFATEQSMNEGLAGLYDPLDLKPAGLELVDWLENGCNYRIWITEHNAPLHDGAWAAHDKENT